MQFGLSTLMSEQYILYIVCNFKHCRHLILTTLYTYISVEKNTNKSWVIDGTMIIEEYLGTSDGAARSPPLPRNTKCPSGRCSSWGMLQPTDAFHSTGLGRFEPITALGTRKLTRRMMQDRPKSGRGRRILSMRWLPSRSIHKMLPFPFSVRFYLVFTFIQLSLFGAESRWDAGRPAPWRENLKVGGKAGPTTGPTGRDRMLGWTELPWWYLWWIGGPPRRLEGRLEAGRGLCRQERQSLVSSSSCRYEPEYKEGSSPLCGPWKCPWSWH